jgi:hypothetical protein
MRMVNPIPGTRPTPPRTAATALVEALATMAAERGPGPDPSARSGRSVGEASSAISQPTNRALLGDRSVRRRQGRVRDPRERTPVWNRPGIQERQQRSGRQVKARSAPQPDAAARVGLPSRG